MYFVLLDIKNIEIRIMRVVVEVMFKWKYFCFCFFNSISITNIEKLMQIDPLFTYFVIKFVVCIFDKTTLCYWKSQVFGENILHSLNLHILTMMQLRYKISKILILISKIFLEILIALNCGIWILIWFMQPLKTWVKLFLAYNIPFICAHQRIIQHWEFHFKWKGFFMVWYNY